MSSLKHAKTTLANPAEAINQHLGRRVKKLRTERGWSLEGLAGASGVSRSMLSQIEREQALMAESHQRSPERQGYANGFKAKTLKTRVGQVDLRIPQTRSYRDEHGRPFYPRSLERGVRSERAMTLAVAEMYVQGVSTRKVTAIVEEL